MVATRQVMAETMGGGVGVGGRGRGNFCQHHFMGQDRTFSSLYTSTGNARDCYVIVHMSNLDR